MYIRVRVHMDNVHYIVIKKEYTPAERIVQCGIVHVSAKHGCILHVCPWIHVVYECIHALIVLRMCTCTCACTLPHPHARAGQGLRLIPQLFDVVCRKTKHVYACTPYPFELHNSIYHGLYAGQVTEVSG